MAEKSGAEKKKGGLGEIVVAAVILAVLGGGGGAGFALMTATKTPPAESTAAEGGKGHTAAAPAKGGGGHGAGSHGADHGDGEAGQRADAGVPHVLDLAPIVAQLSHPEKTWVRLELAVALAEQEGKDPALTLAELGQDFLLLLRSMTLAQLSHPSSIALLREDLADLAAIRSKGAVREVFLKAVVVE